MVAELLGAVRPRLPPCGYRNMQSAYLGRFFGFPRLVVLAGWGHIFTGAGKTTLVLDTSRQVCKSLSHGWHVRVWLQHALETSSNYRYVLGG